MDANKENCKHNIQEWVSGPENYVLKCACCGDVLGACDYACCPTLGLFRANVKG